MNNDIPPAMTPDIEKQKIVCAACMHKKTGKIIAGARHFDRIMLMQIKDGEEGKWADCLQGFIDQYFTTSTDPIRLLPIGFPAV